jgi:hypothetical protein
MPIYKKSTSGGGSSPRGRFRPPTLQMWVALQPSWLVTGMLAPHSRLAVYASVPVGAGIAWLAGKLGLERTPTWIGLLTACMGYVCTRVLGVHAVASIALGQTGDKLTVTATIVSCYAVMEFAARAPQWWNAFIESVAAKLSMAMGADPPPGGIDLAE